jgi:hypothetical protein
MVKISELLDRLCPKPVDREYMERIWSALGFSVDASSEQCIYYHHYKLYYEWMDDYQQNYIRISCKFRVHKEEFDKFLVIANNINKEIKVVKAFVHPSSKEEGQYRLEIVADSFLSGIDKMTDICVLNALLAHLRSAGRRVMEMKKDI